MDVFNEQSDMIFARISNSTNPSESELFYATTQGHVWTRFGPEVIFVNGPTGTAVATYYGKPEHALSVNSPMYVVFVLFWRFRLLKSIYFLFLPQLYGM